MVAAMTCYSAGMRTPCYNWMMLLGGMLAWSGWLRYGLGRAASLEMGLGLAVAMAGKWGSALVLVTLFAGLSLANQKTSFGPKPKDWGTAILTFAASAVVFGVYAGWAGIRDTLQAGLLIAQTTGSHGWFIVPKYGWELFYFLYRIGRAFVWLLPAILFFWWLAKKNHEKWTTSRIATILFSGGLLLAAGRGWWRGGIEQFGKESVLAGCWLLGVAWTAWVVRSGADTRIKRIEGREQMMAEGVPSSVLWGLVLTPFLCGIGTNTSIADYAGQGAVFFVAAGILILGSLPAASFRAVAAVSLAGLCLIQASRVSSSLLGMYRLGSVLEQNENLGVGPEAGRLQVDRNTRLQVETIYEIIRRSGFRPGTPVVGVDSLCGWVYLVGATSPGVPWVFMDQKTYLSEVLKIIPAKLLGQSWVWIRSSSKLQEIQSWWPSRGIRFPKRQAGEISFSSDRGDEVLRLFSPSP
jgi:hypothetical protein